MYRSLTPTHIIVTCKGAHKDQLPYVCAGRNNGSRESRKYNVRREKSIEGLLRSAQCYIIILADVGSNKLQVTHE